MYQRLSVLVIALALVTPARAFAGFTRAHASGSVHSAHHVPKASTYRRRASDRQGKAPFEGNRDRVTSIDVERDEARQRKRPVIVIDGTDASHLHPLIKGGCGASADCYQYTWQRILERPDRSHILTMSADAAAPYIKKLTRDSWRRTELDVHSVRLFSLQSADESSPSEKSGTQAVLATSPVTGDSQIAAGRTQPKRWLTKKRFIVKNTAFDDQVLTGSAPTDIEAELEHFRLTHPHLRNELDRLTAPTAAPDAGGRPSKFVMRLRAALGEQEK